MGQMNEERRATIRAAIVGENGYLNDPGNSWIVDAMADGIEAGLYYAPQEPRLPDYLPVGLGVSAARGHAEGFQAGVDWMRGQLLEQIAGLRASAVRLDHHFGHDDEAADRVLEFVEKRIEDLGVRW